MPIYLGSTPVTMYIGNTLLDSIYLGGTLVASGSTAFELVYTTSSTTGVVLYDDLITAGWNGTDDVDVLIEEDVIIGAPDTDTFSMDCATMPDTVALLLHGPGRILGQGGEGGRGGDDDGGGTAQPGGYGGPALRLGCVTSIGADLEIKGGGGGGGGGAMRGIATWTDGGDKGGCAQGVAYSGGTGGGGGAGYPGGAGGIETISGSYTGNPGTDTAGGSALTKSGTTIGNCPATSLVSQRGGNGGALSGGGFTGQSGSAHGAVNSTEAAAQPGGAGGEDVTNNGFTPTYL